jgi:hypothetical protein
MEFLMKMFLNTSGVPLNSIKPRLDGRIVGGVEIEIDITDFPFQVWRLCCCSV